MGNIDAMPLQDFPKTFANSLLRKGLLDKIENISTGSVLFVPWQDTESLPS